ncbi:hypothetical protein J4411_00890 [Candidatus Pacearchaeota archaeon]|nr:hypothetical protein [uncultured archaeon]MBS3084451.1 hypothetical protein [Candidatus Pacearchaeota archaeon]
MNFRFTWIKAILAIIIVVLGFLGLQFGLIACYGVAPQVIGGEVYNLCGSQFSIYTNILFGIAIGLIFYPIYSLFQRK